MALSTPRKITRLAVGPAVYLVAAGAACIQSGLAILDGGFARPARAGQGGTDALKAASAAGYQAVGVFSESVTGGVADGDKSVQVETGVFNFRNSAGVDAITAADIGKAAFIVDDETVAKTSASSTRAPAGPVVAVDEDGVWVHVEPEAANIGRRTLILPFFISQTDLLAGTSAELVCPVKGNIVRMSGVAQAAITTGGPITASVGVTAVNGLAVVFADGAPKGTVATDTPTAGHATTAVVPGDRLQVTPDASFATAGAVNGFVEIAY